MKINKKNFFICFTGIDGSGKTTLSKMLVNEMNENGIITKYVWCGWRRFEFFLVRPLISIIKSVGRRFHQNRDSESNTLARVDNPVYSYLVLIDYFFTCITKIGIPLLIGQNIICDRYVYDLIVDLWQNHTMTQKIVLNLLPKPDLIFLVNLSEEIAYRRKDDIPSLEFLKKRKNLYLEMAKKFDMTVLDGSFELGDLRNIIVRQANNLYKNNISVRGSGEK